MSDSNALTKLLESNAQWAKTVISADPDFFKRSAKGQFPKFLWLGCSDSRVPESVITASRPGDIFTHRNIANQVHPYDDNVLSVITYAVAPVDVEHILVVGHTHCGGVEACYKAVIGKTPPPDPNTPLGRWLAPLIALTRTLNIQSVPEPEALSKILNASVRAQVENVAGTAPVQKAWADKKKLWVHGLVYEIETGTLRNLNITRGPPA